MTANNSHHRRRSISALSGSTAHNLTPRRPRARRNRFIHAAAAGLHALRGDYASAIRSGVRALPSVKWKTVQDDIKRNSGTGGERQATVKRHRKKSVTFKKPKKVKVSKNFKLKVDKALSPQQIHGSFREISYNQLSTQSIANGQQFVALMAPNSINTAAGGPSAIDQSKVTQYDWSPWCFDPENFLHQLSVLFNNKANSQNTIREWYAQGNLGVLSSVGVGNVPPSADDGTNANTSSSSSIQPMPIKFTVKKAYEVYRLRNNSQRTLHIKIYLCAPKTTAAKAPTSNEISESGTTPTSQATQDCIYDPVSAWWACVGQQFNQSINVSGTKPNSLYMSPLANPLFKKTFNVEETTMIIEPGQTTSYTVNGPSNMEIDWQKLYKPQTLGTGNVLNTAQTLYQGIQKFMRCPMIVVNEDLVQQNAGSYNPGRYPAVTATAKDLGLIIERDVMAKFKMPEMTGGTINGYSLAFGTDRTIQNTQRRSAYAHYVYSLTGSQQFIRYDEEVPTVAEAQ